MIPYNNEELKAM